jgi:hypothetical protein
MLSLPQMCNCHVSCSARVHRQEHPPHSHAYCRVGRKELDYNSDSAVPTPHGCVYATSPTWRYHCDQAAACTDDKRAPCKTIQSIIFRCLAVGSIQKHQQQLPLNRSLWTPCEQFLHSLLAGRFNTSRAQSLCGCISMSIPCLGLNCLAVELNCIPSSTHAATANDQLLLLPPPARVWCMLLRRPAVHAQQMRALLSVRQQLSCSPCRSQAAAQMPAAVPAAAAAASAGLSTGTLCMWWQWRTRPGLMQFSCWASSWCCGGMARASGSAWRMLAPTGRTECGQMLHYAQRQQQQQQIC